LALRRIRLRGLSGGEGVATGCCLATAARDVLVLAVQGFGTAAQRAAAIVETVVAYAVALAKIPDDVGKTSGITVGRAVAAVLAELFGTDQIAFTMTSGAQNLPHLLDRICP
jgi:hypothetical protein